MDGFKPMVKMKCGGSVSKAVEKAKMCSGGETKKYKEGGKTDLAQDKALIKKAISQHDKQEHPGEKTELKLKQGGRSKKAVGTVKKFAKGGAIGMKKDAGDKADIKKIKATNNKKAAAPSKAAVKPKASPKKMADGGILDQGLQNQSIAAAAQPAQPMQDPTMGAQNALTNALQNFKMPSFTPSVDPRARYNATMAAAKAAPNASDNRPAPHAAAPRAISPEQEAQAKQAAIQQQNGIDTRQRSAAMDALNADYAQQLADLKIQRDTDNTGPNANGARALIDFGNNLNTLNDQRKQKNAAIFAKNPIRRADGGLIDLMQGQGVISDNERNLMRGQDANPMPGNNSGQGAQSDNAYDRFKSQNPNAKRGLNRKQIEALINSPQFRNASRGFTDK